MNAYITLTPPWGDRPVKQFSGIEVISLKKWGGGEGGVRRCIQVAQEKQEQYAPGAASNKTSRSGINSRKRNGMITGVNKT